MVIPAELVDEVVAECTKMTLFETFVLAQVQAGKTIVGLYPLTSDAVKRDFEAWKKAR